MARPSVVCPCCSAPGVIPQAAAAAAASTARRA